MIKLYDWLNQESLDLDYSLRQAGYEGVSIVINDDGFLPKEITSPYAYFCGFDQIQEGRPLYFNELPVPDFWQIAGTNQQAEVFDYNQKKANIFYAEPKHRRFIKNVDWLSPDGKTRFTDHYNQYGWQFACTHFTADQQATIKTYMDRKGQEIIVENFNTGDIILNWLGKIYFFKNRVEFLDFYFDQLTFDNSEIWFNSLSTPFFLSRYLGNEGEDILFWQEDIGDVIPGNMLAIFNSPEARVKRIVVQKRSAYEKLLALLPANQHSRVSYLGYSYPEKGQPTGGQEILILTNSDKIESLEALVTGLPNHTFHIGALTEMSSRLTAYAKYPNVCLYPNISMTRVDKLYQLCDIYLDINYGSEILQGVRRAFEYNHLIFAYDTTVHNRELILSEHIFAKEASQQLIQTIQALDDYKGAIQTQRHGTVFESRQAYRRVLG